MLDVGCFGADGGYPVPNSLGDEFRTIVGADMAGDATVKANKYRATAIVPLRLDSRASISLLGADLDIAPFRTHSESPRLIAIP